MANTPQSRKRVRQATKARNRNASQKSEFRTSLKKVLKSITDKNKGYETDYDDMPNLIPSED